MKIIIGTFLVSLGLLSVPALSKPSKVPPAPPAPELVPLISNQQYKEMMSQARKGRQVANETDTFDYSKAYSDDAKNLQSRINGGPIWKDGKETAERRPGLNSPADITVFINELEKEYKNLKPDAQFVAAFWIAMKPWKGFFNRIRPLIERHNLSQSLAVTFLRASFAGINVFLPDTPSWDAGFNYLAMPSKDMEPDIEDEEVLYKFAHEKILPALDAFNDRLAKLNFTNPIYFDNQLLVRSANFFSTRDRHIRLGEAERQAVLAGGLFAYSNLSGSIAYSWDGFFRALDHLGKVYGFTSELSDGSMTAKRRFKEIEKSSSLLFTLRPGGKDWTQNISRPRFEEGLKAARTSWVWLKNNGGNNEATRNIFDPRAFIPFTRIIDTSFENIDSLWENTGVVSAVVNGETLDIDFQKLFREPPSDLKAFFPNDFHGGKNIETDSITGKKYRNFNFGNPNGWNHTVYKKYFPSVENNDGVKRTARILNQAWGGWMLGIPITGMMM